MENRLIGFLDGREVLIGTTLEEILEFLKDYQRFIRDSLQERALNKIIKNVVAASLLDIDEKIKLCSDFKDLEQKVCLKYIILLCDDLRMLLAALCDYDLNYEPTEVEISVYIKDRFGVYLNRMIEDGLLYYDPEKEVYTCEKWLDAGEPDQRAISNNDRIGVFSALSEEMESYAISDLEYEYDLKHTKIIDHLTKVRDKIKFVLDQIRQIDTKKELWENAQKTIKARNTATLSDLLNHQHPDILLSRIKEELKGKKGKHVAKLTKALEYLNYLKPRESNSQLIRLLENEIGDVGSKTSINRYLNGTGGAVIDDEEIKKCCDRIRIEA